MFPARSRGISFGHSHACYCDAKISTPPLSPFMVIAVEDANALPSSPAADPKDPATSGSSVNVAARCKDPEQVTVCRVIT